MNFVQCVQYMCTVEGGAEDQELISDITYQDKELMLIWLIGGDD